MNLKDLYDIEAKDMEKQAGILDQSDIEKAMNLYIPDEFEPLTNTQIAGETAKSTALQHPWLTGIPTLGIWPAIAKAKAIENIKASIMRSVPNLRETAYEREKDLAPIEAARVGASNNAGINQALKTMMLLNAMGNMKNTNVIV